MTEDKKPREMWIHSYDCIDHVRDDVAWTQEQHQEKLGLSDMSIHVIEYSAYAQLKRDFYFLKNPSESIYKEDV